MKLPMFNSMTAHLEERDSLVYVQESGYASLGRGSIHPGGGPTSLGCLDWGGGGGGSSDPRLFGPECPTLLGSKDQGPFQGGGANYPTTPGIDRNSNLRHCWMM